MVHCWWLLQTWARVPVPCQPTLLATAWWPLGVLCRCTWHACGCCATGHPRIQLLWVCPAAAGMATPATPAPLPPPPQRQPQAGANSSTTPCHRGTRAPMVHLLLLRSSHSNLGSSSRPQAHRPPERAPLMRYRISNRIPRPSLQSGVMSSSGLSRRDPAVSLALVEKRVCKQHLARRLVSFWGAARPLPGQVEGLAIRPLTADWDAGGRGLYL
jgi:hypothetical protein